MNCTECQNQLSDYFDSQLPRDEHERIEEHMNACEPCTQTFKEFQLIVANAASLEKYTAPNALWNKIEAELDTSQIGLFDRLSLSIRKMKQRLSSLAVLPVPAMRFALAGLLVVIGVFIGRYFIPTNSEYSQDYAAVEKQVDLQALNTRAEKYLESSKVLLLGIVNLEKENDAPVDLGIERQLSAKLLREAAFLKENLPSTRNEHIRRLVTELELILLEIANLEEQADFENIELLKSGIDRTDMLLKVNLNGLNDELLVPVVNKNGL